MKDAKTNSEMENEVIYTTGLKNREAFGNYLFVRDAETNALVPVIAEYDPGEEYETIGNSIFKRDPETNAIIPVRVIENKPWRWAPQPDWFDYRKIFDQDPDPNKRLIILSHDNSPVWSFSVNSWGGAGSYYRMSDGTVYGKPPATVNHTWDLAKDKPCGLGYKTRWVIIYNPSRSISLYLPSQPLLAILFGDCSLSSLNLQSGDQNDKVYELQSLEVKDVKTFECNSVSFQLASSIANNELIPFIKTIGDYQFLNNLLLKDVTFHEGVTAIGLQSFSKTSLFRVEVPEGVISIGGSAFSGCLNLSFIKLPSSLTTIAADFLTNCYALLSVAIAPGLVFPTGLSLANCPKLSVSGLIDLFNNLGTNTGTVVTITLFQKVKQRLLSIQEGIDAIAVATSKNYTIA